MTTVNSVLPGVRFGSAEKPNSTPPTPPPIPTGELPQDTFVFGYQSDANYDVAVDHRHRKTNGTFTPAPTEGGEPTGTASVVHNNDGLNVSVRVNGQVTSDVLAAGHKEGTGVNGRGHIVLNVGDKKPFTVGVGVTEDTELLHSNDASRPTRQVLSNNQVGVTVDGLKDETYVAVTPGTLAAQLATTLNNGVITYEGRRQTNGVTLNVEPVAGGSDAVATTDEGGDGAAAVVTAVGTPVRQRTGLQRNVTVNLGTSAVVQPVKKDGDEAEPAPVPGQPVVLQYRVDGSREVTPGSLSVNGQVNASAVVPFKVATTSSAVTFTNPEQTEAETDLTQARHTSTTSGHVKVDGKGTLRLKLPTPTPPPSSSTDAPTTPPPSGGGFNPTAFFGALLTGRISQAVRQVVTSGTSTTPPNTDPPALTNGSANDATNGDGPPVTP